MEVLAQIYSFLSSQGFSDILSAVFMVIGGLKVIARYTPFKWDDQLLAAVEAPLVFLRDLKKPKEDK